ncbi:phage tail tape measure protein [Actinomadura decatromicini]|uniref:Phage tail tape measure protein domain-containing protein n=1 Tax=Actinomadura decatromicini TaxID=2604572 RepID=A0A5D3FFX2_9ACTN|nr:phage tail tape measure protein [Actinomadura decatromicini]TYK47151.1 hypothetical protein FXF68_25450 [Actinomadura decatromicini]
MALDLGELVGTISLDDRGFTRPMQQAERGINRLESTTRSSLDRVEDDFEQTGRAAARELGQGLDRAADEAGQAGKKAGDEFVRGTESRIRNGRSRFSRSGRDAGEGAGEGVGEGAERGGKGKFKGLAGKFAGLMKAGPWLAAGAVVGGVFMTGLAGAMERQDSVAKLKAQVGAFGPEAERLGKIAGGLYNKGYGAEMGQVTEAVGAVVTSIDGMRGANESAVQAMTARALDLADVFELDVNRSMQVVGQMVKTGLVKNATEGVDLLTAVLQRVPANVREDVVDALDEYGPFMNQIGIKGKKAFELLAQGAAKGMYGIDKTGDALKEFTIRSTDMSTSTQEAYKTLGLSTSKMTKDLLAGGARGGKAFDLIISKLRGIKDPAKQSQAALALFGTPLEDLNTGEIPKFLASLDTTQNSLGKTAGAADRMGKTLHDTASQNLTTFERTVKGKVVDLFGGKVLPGLTKFGGKANAFFQRWVGDNQGTVDKVKRVWDKAGDKVGDAIGGIKKWLDENKDKVEEWSNKIGQIVGLAADTISGAIDIISGAWSIFGGPLLTILSTFIDGFLGYWSGVFRMIKGIFDVFAGIFTGDWGRVWDGIKGIVGGAVQVVWSILQGAVKLFTLPMRLIGKLLGALTKWAWDKVKGFVRSGVRNVLAAIFGLAVLPGRVASYFGRMALAAISKAAGLVRWMRGLPGRIRRGIGGMNSLLYNAGRNVISGLIRGITSKVGDVGGAMRNIAGKIRNYLPFSPAKEGPLSGRGSPQLSGEKIGIMLAAGITTSRGRVASAATGLARTVTSAQATAFTKRRGGPRLTGERYGVTLAEGITHSGPRIMSAVTGVTRILRSAQASAFTVRRPAPAPGRGDDGSSTAVTVILDVRGGPAEFKKMIREWVRVEGRGNVQLAFGQRGR